MDLTKGSIFRRMLRFTIPIIIIQFLNQAYTIVDNVIVARFVSDRALSVLSTVNSALMIGYCINQGLGAATTILIGNIYGSKKYEKLRATVRMLLWGALLMGVMIFLAFTFGRTVIFEWLHVPDQITEDCRRLMFIYALSLPPTVMCSASTAMLNGMGNSKTPMFISVSAQVLNIILDYVAVVILDQGVGGAAIASLISVVVAMIATFKFLKEQLLGVTTEEQEGEFSCDKNAEEIEVWDMAFAKQYVYLAAPSIIQQSIMAVGNLMLQVLVNEEGVDYINGYNVSNTLFNFFALWIMSCCIGFETFAAQNYGARNKERVKKGFQTLLGMGFVLCLIVSLMSWLLAKPLILLYLKNSTQISFDFAKVFLLFLIPNYFLILGKNSVDALFKAQMKVYLFTVSSFLALFVRILLGYTMSPYYGLMALAMATILGNAVAMMFDWFCLWISQKKQSSLVVDNSIG